MAQNIEFIGVALGVSLLLYVELEVKALELKGRRKTGTQTASDCFLVSLLLFLSSAIIDWAESVQQLPVLYQNPWLMYGEAIAFVSGLIVFGIGIGVLREVGRKGKITKVSWVTYFIVPMSSIWITINGGIFLASLTYWNAMDWVGHTFTPLLGITTAGAVALLLISRGKKPLYLLLAYVVTGMPWLFLTVALYVQPTSHGVL